MDKSRNSFVYISTDSSRDHGGIEEQKKLAERFAKDRDLNIIEFFVDETSVSTPMHKREGYSELNKAIVSGKANIVIIPHPDSIATEKRDRQGVIHNFAEKGIELFIAFTGEYINPSDPLTREQRLLAEAMREMEDTEARVSQR